MKYEFDAEIKRLEGKIQWSVFYFPESAADCFGSKGNIPVKITVDGHLFDHTLLPSRNGHYRIGWGCKGLMTPYELKRCVGRIMVVYCADGAAELLLAFNRGH